jgi:hypothetical protein
VEHGIKISHQISSQGIKVLAKTSSCMDHLVRETTEIGCIQTVSTEKKG